MKSNQEIIFYKNKPSIIPTHRISTHLHRNRFSFIRGSPSNIFLPSSVDLHWLSWERVVSLHPTLCQWWNRHRQRRWRHSRIKAGNWHGRRIRWNRNVHWNRGVRDKWRWNVKGLRNILNAHEPRWRNRRWIC